MNQSAGSEVVVIGAGVVGCATAYYLGKEGVKATIIERDTLGGHASGFSLGGLIPLAGVGIPKPILEKIFEPFFTTKNVNKGTGLGLSISYGIVQDYGGTIEVETQEGEGSRFIVRFPILDEV